MPHRAVNLELRIGACEAAIGFTVMAFLIFPDPCLAVAFLTAPGCLILGGMVLLRWLHGNKD